MASLKLHMACMQNAEINYKASVFNELSPVSDFTPERIDGLVALVLSVMEMFDTANDPEHLASIIKISQV